MKVLLAGASGFVGSRVLGDLLVAGHHVTAIVHSGRSVNEIQQAHPAVEVLSLEMADMEQTERVPMQGIEAVIYLPGLLREFPRKGITFQKVHFDGVRNLLAAARRAGVRRWIQMSALGARVDATTKYHKTKWEAEGLVRASGMKWTILRPSVIFDTIPSPKANFVEEMAKIIRRSPFIPVLGDGKYRMQPVSLDDVSHTILQSLGNPGTLGKTYEIGGLEQLSYNEIVGQIARALGKKRSLVHLPFRIAALAGRMLGGFSFFPFTEEQLVMLKEENIVIDQKKDQEWRADFRLPMIGFGEGVMACYRNER